MKSLLINADASWQEYELEFAKRLNSLDISVIDNYALSCDAKLLPYLASAYSVSVDGLDEKEARALINDALLMHFKAGTAWAMRKLITTFSEGAKLYEWWEYGGKPNHFKVDLALASEGVIDAAKIKKYKELILKIKNVHSVLEGFDILLRDVYIEIKIAIAGKLNKRFASVINIAKDKELKCELASALSLQIRQRSVHKKSYKDTRLINLATALALRLAQTNKRAFRADKTMACALTSAGLLKIKGESR